MSSNEKIKILQVAKWSPTTFGGIEKVIRDITDGISPKSDMKILVCSENNSLGEEVLSNGAKLIRAKTIIKMCSMPISISYLFKFRKLSKNIDIMQFHAPFPLHDLALFLCRRKKVKKVVWWHSDVVKQKKLMFFYKPLMNWFLKQMDVIMLADKTIANQSKYLAPYLDKIKVIPFGIDTEMYLNSRFTPILSDKLNDKSNLKLLFVGRLVYYKGLEILLSAMKEIHGVELFVVGAGDLQNEIEQSIKAKGIEKSVHLFGQLSDEDLKSSFKDCDVFVLPSISPSECFGLVQLEAMVYGKPVINTNLKTAVPTVSIDKETGLTVSPENIEELKDAIIQLRDNEDLRKKYGVAAEKRCKEKYDLKHMQDNVYNVYENLIQK